MYIKSAVAERITFLRSFQRIEPVTRTCNGSTLEKIFFIRHGAKNTLGKLTTLDAANRLMVRCFPTFWHRAGMSFALGFCARIAAGIECYEFGFVPDQSAVEYIKDVV